MDKESSKPVRPSFVKIKVGPICINLNWLGTFLIVTTVALYAILPSWPIVSTRKATGSSFAHLAAHCADKVPITAPSFYSRQAALARTLHSLNASAYIAEPGPSASFFANISNSNWHLSERPLLLIVSPKLDDNEGIKADISVLTPTFEATRAKLLPVPAQGGVSFPTWNEDADPYATALSSLQVGTIFVDGAIRHFIVDGLQHAAPHVQISAAPEEIRHLREQKSADELELMKCANEATVLAIRAVREKMHIGMRESEGRRLVESALAAAGLTNTFALVLFGENAALPHGGKADRTLTDSDLILVDAGGALHGYNSDVTRTFALPDSQIPAEHVAIWRHVRSAQDLAAATAWAGVAAQNVDASARGYLTAMGYGQYFTHRLGHGIGLEVHEGPYLRGGSGDILARGHTFSDEPGVYIEGQVGVRLEDCFYIDDSVMGRAVFLTAGVGGQARDPWNP